MMVMTIMVMITFDDEEGLSMLVKLLMSYTYIFLQCQALAPVKKSKGEEEIWRKLRKRIRKRVRTLQHFTL